LPDEGVTRLAGRRRHNGRASLRDHEEGRHRSGSRPPHAKTGPRVDEARASPVGARRRDASRRQLASSGEGIAEEVVDGLPADAERVGNRARGPPLDAHPFKTRHTPIRDTPKAAAISAGPLPSLCILRTSSNGTEGLPREHPVAPLAEHDADVGLDGGWPATPQR